MDSKQFQKLIQGAANSSKSRNKYNAKKVNDPVHGVFDSQGEYGHFKKLVTLEMAGLLTDLKRQVRYELVVNGVKVGVYTADFVYVDQEGKTVVEDFKGAYRLPPDVPLRMKLMKALHGIDVQLVGRHKK